MKNYYNLEKKKNNLYNLNGGQITSASDLLKNEAWKQSFRNTLYQVTYGSLDLLKDVMNDSTCITSLNSNEKENKKAVDQLDKTLCKTHILEVIKNMYLIPTSIQNIQKYFLWLLIGQGIIIICLLIIIFTL